MNEFDARPGSTMGSTLRARAIAIASELAHTSARDIAHIIFRRKAIIVSVFLVIVFATLGYIVITPFSYESKTQLLIRPGRENIAIDSTMVSGAGGTMAPNSENAVNAAVSILQSRALAEKVVKNLGDDVLPSDTETETDTFADTIKDTIRWGIGLPKTIVSLLKPDDNKVPTSPEEIAAAKIAGAMTVAVEKRTNIINVAYRADTPDLAQQTLQKITDQFLARHIEVYAPKTSEQFFEEKLKTLEANLIEKQNKRDEYQKTYGIGTIQSQKDAIVTQINTSEVNRSTVASEISASQARIKALEASLVDRPQTIVTSETEGLLNPMADKLKSDLADLRLQEMDMAARYADTYRPLVELREQVKQVETMLTAEQASTKTTTTAPDPGYQTLKLDLDTERANVEALLAQEKSLATDVETWREKLASLSDQEGQLATLEREFTIAEKEFLSYQEGFLRTRTAIALDMEQISNVSVVQPATFSSAPASPNIMRLLALGLFLAVFGSVFSAFAFEYIDSRVYTKEDIEKHVATNVLAVITDKEFRKLPMSAGMSPLFVSEETEGANSRALVPLNGKFQTTALSISEKMFSLNRRISVLMEYSTAGMALIFADTEGPRTSSKIAFEYAQIIANQGRRVLVLGLGPMNHPSLKQNLPTNKEWQAVMNDGLVADNLIRQYADSNMYYSQIGLEDASLRLLASSPQFEPLIYKIRSQYDVVLIDCPPLSESGMATRISQISDGSILVAEAGKTRWQVIYNQVRDFQSNQGRVIGVILKNRKYYIPQFIYNRL